MNSMINEQFYQKQGWALGTAYIWRPASDFWLQKESDFPQWLQSYTRYGDAAISNSTINARIRYGSSAHVGDGCKLLRLSILYIEYHWL